MSEEDAAGSGGPTTVADPTAAGDAAIGAYTRRMRPLRIAYAVVVTVVVVIALVVVKIAYDHGELSHTHLHTVTSAPPSVANSATPAAGLSKAWSSTDTTALGTPVAEGTVVTHDAHTVRGRNALTGAQTWSYTRTDRTVCAAVQTELVTVAVYRLDGSCDELTALESTTGQRRWTRTLDTDGAVFDGPTRYYVDGSSVMFVSRTSIYTLAVSGTADSGNGGLNEWTFYHRGCTIDGAVLGSAGALISQSCQGQDCQGHKFCGDGHQLLLRDGAANYDEKSTTNPDVVKWNDLGKDLVPTSAGATVTARDPNGATLTSLAAGTGKSLGTIALSGDSGAAAPSAFAFGTDADLIWIGQHTYALPRGKTSFAWQAATTGLPTPSHSTAILAGSPALAPTTSGAVALDPADGTVTARYPVAAPEPGGTVVPLGAGVLVTGSPTVVYR
ncbi:MAG TPA: PQQ-binding-like beta-propeller repeat protein [Jatrophihabitans sp.]|jgi:hypothetical protein